MATFATMFGDLMDTVSRPQADTATLTKAKSCINEAINSVQASHEFARLLLSAPTATYTANSTTVSLENLTGQVVRSVQSVQMVTSANPYGLILPLHSISVLTRSRMQYQMKQSGVIVEDLNYIYADLGHANLSSAIYKYVAYLQGNSLGLYPRPAADVTLAINYYVWAAALSGDSDSNIFTNYGYDYIFMLALKKLMIYLKMTSDYPYTENEVNFARDAFLKWDASQSTGDLNNF
jgi:hypothetical protein